MPSSRQLPRLALWNSCEKQVSSIWYDVIQKRQLAPRRGQYDQTWVIVYRMKATLRHIYLCRTANMSWRTCVVVNQIQSNPIQSGGLERASAFPCFFPGQWLIVNLNWKMCSIHRASCLWGYFSCCLSILFDEQAMTCSPSLTWEIIPPFATFDASVSRM